MCIYCLSNSTIVTLKNSQFNPPKYLHTKENYGRYETEMDQFFPNFLELQMATPKVDRGIESKEDYKDELYTTRNRIQSIVVENFNAQLYVGCSQEGKWS